MNITVSIPEDLSAFVRAKVESGKYGSTSEVMQDALRLLEREDQIHQNELEDHRRLVDEGLASGRAGPFDAEKIRNAGRKLIGQE